MKAPFAVRDSGPNHGPNHGPDNSNQSALNRLQAYGLLGLHAGLSLFGCLIVYGIFALWPNLSAAGQSLFMIVGTVALSLITSFANLRAARHLWQSLRNPQRFLPPPDITSLFLAVFMIGVAISLFAGF